MAIGHWWGEFDAGRRGVRVHLTCSCKDQHITLSHFHYRNLLQKPIKMESSWWWVDSLNDRQAKVLGKQKRVTPSTCERCECVWRCWGEHYPLAGSVMVWGRRPSPPGRTTHCPEDDWCPDWGARPDVAGAAPNHVETLLSHICSLVCLWKINH